MCFSKTVQVGDNKEIEEQLDVGDSLMMKEYRLLATIFFIKIGATSTRNRGLRDLCRSGFLLRYDLASN